VSRPALIVTEQPGVSFPFLDYIKCYVYF